MQIVPRPLLAARAFRLRAPNNRRCPGNFLRAASQALLLAGSPSKLRDHGAQSIPACPSPDHARRLNLYPDDAGDGFIAFDSMINIRPAQGNRSRGVGDDGLRVKIRSLVAKLVSDA